MAYEYIYKNFEHYFPQIAKAASNHYYTEKLELMVELDNGDRYLYDEIFNSIRRLPRDADAMTKDEYKSDFGARLLKVMSWKGVTQEELAKRTGIPQSMISRYINGENDPSFYKVDRIARALGVSVDEFRFLD